MRNNVIIIGILLIGAWFIFGAKKILKDSSPSAQIGTMSPTSNVTFTPSITKASYESRPLQHNNASVQHYGMSYVSPDYHVEMFQHPSAPVQSSGARTLYSTASVSPHSIGSGTANPIGGSQNTTRVNRGTLSAYSSQAGNLHTFIAMSSPVRKTTDEFRDGENAIGSDSPNGVIRRTPGSGPVTEDPEHQPTIVGTTPIGDGVHFMMLLVIGYLLWNLKKGHQKSLNQ